MSFCGCLGWAKPAEPIESHGADGRRKSNLQNGSENGHGRQSTEAPSPQKNLVHSIIPSHVGPRKPSFTSPPKSASTSAPDPPPPPPLQLSLEELKEATGGFQQEAYLGEGASGRTFEGQLFTGARLAVKVLKDANIPEDLFLKQVAVLSSLHHPNVVSLLGYCVDSDSRVLAYEYAPAGSLYDLLHGWKEPSASSSSSHHLHLLPSGKPAPVVHWAHRVKLALGAAHGLNYLHQLAPPSSSSSPAGIPHGALCSSNVLLWEEYTARLGDCRGGLGGAGGTHLDAFDHEFTSHSLPEHELLKKADIYAFGVVLLELLTGRKSVDPTAPHSQQSLVDWAMPRLTPEKVLTVVDPRLKGRFPDEGPLRLGLVAALCMDDVEFRPTMTTVIKALQALVTMPMPHRAYNSEQLSRH